MSYGLEFTNNSNVVTLDSEYARLSVVFSGRYRPTEESNLGSTTYFPRAITSQEAPLVFVKPDAAGVAAVCLTRIIGSPGNWTGFYLRTYSNSTAQPNGEYFVASFVAAAVSTYGMQMWGGDSGLIFDAGTPSAVFTRAYQNWDYEKYTYTAPNYTNYYKVSGGGLPSANEFVLINNFGMYMIAGGAQGRIVTLLWDFPNNTLRAITSAASNPYTLYIPALFAKKVA